MLWKRLTRHLFAPPSHQRGDLLFGFGFGTLWLFISLSEGFVLPFPLVAVVLFAIGTAEILPRSWILLAGIIRTIVLLSAVIATIWSTLLFFGWLHL
jgi:hypothetical protein